MPYKTFEKNLDANMNRKKLKECKNLMKKITLIEDFLFNLKCNYKDMYRIKKVTHQKKRLHKKCF